MLMQIFSIVLRYTAELIQIIIVGLSTSLTHFTIDMEIEIKEKDFKFIFSFLFFLLFLIAAFHLQHI